MKVRRAQMQCINIFRVYLNYSGNNYGCNRIILIGGVVLSVHRSLNLFLILAVIATYCR
jgi:hypothetical protein